MKRFLTFVVYALFAITCTKDERPATGVSNQIVVSTSNVSTVTATSALVNGAITSDGGEKIVERGFCWNTTEAPTVNNNKITLSGNSLFSANILGLSPGVTYALRAYVKSSNDLVYGNEVKFKTVNLPVLTTAAISNITASTATSGGTISSTGGLTITESGICWNTTTAPTILNNKAISGNTSIGSYTSNLTGLTANTTYSVRAYATTSAGTSYGNEISFKTVALSSITTSNASSITLSSAASGGNITSDGGSPITERGICWSTNPSPTISNSLIRSGTGTGIFNVTINNLLSNTRYYVRSYAINTAGISYGNEISFLTHGLPEVTTSTAINITASDAVSGGNVTNEGGVLVTSRGVCWSTSRLPTILLATKTNNASGSGIFSSSITGLQPGTTYYYRAYATNTYGTSYGAELAFTTPGLLATISTTAVSNITANSAISGGNITSSGGSSVTSKGVCWSTSPSPTIANPRTFDGSGTGVFSSALTGLNPSTIYYARAYATNASGTAYGPQVMFTTSSAPAEVCSITASTTGTVYSMQAPAAGSVFSPGNTYKITMFSPIFSFGQATEVALFRNETKVFSFGSWLLFNESPSNARTFTIPSGLTSSACYTIRVFKAEGASTAVYVSPRFRIQ